MVNFKGPARMIQAGGADDPGGHEREVSFRQITEVRDYRYDDIRPDDIIIDVGANIGAFCIPATQYSDHVVAVEPVTYRILEENIRRSGVPVQVIRGALGDGKPAEITWDECRVTAQTYTLRHIIDMAGGCDFLKCDCEGAEWLIDPRHLEGIRRIEMELHLPPICGPPDPRLLEYIASHYIFEIERKPCHQPLGVMGILHATIL